MVLSNGTKYITCPFQYVVCCMGVTLEVTLGVQIGVGTKSSPIPVNGWDAVIRSRTWVHQSVLACTPSTSGNVEASLVVSLRTKHP